MNQKNFPYINFVLLENINTDVLKSPTRNWQINEHNIDGVATTLADFNTSPMSYCSP